MKDKDRLDTLLAPLAKDTATLAEFQRLRAQGEEMHRRLKGLEETYGQIYAKVTNLSKRLQETSPS